MRAPVAVAFALATIISYAGEEVSSLYSVLCIPHMDVSTLNE
jgi:hypothetical protein